MSEERIESEALADVIAVTEADKKRKPKTKAEPKVAEPAESAYIEGVGEYRPSTPVPLCHSCDNFGSYPNWRPCINCRDNPKNQQSFYRH